jgi:Domain of unknown function (DUF5615)
VAIALYMDEHVHRAITIGLRMRSVDVFTVQEDGLTATPDQLILDRAFELNMDDIWASCFTRVIRQGRSCPSSNTLLSKKYSPHCLLAGVEKEERS